MQLLPDVRLALRRLAAAPGFAAIAVLTLALGIGANSTVFSLINRVLLRPLPVNQPSQLVALNAAEGKQLVPSFSYPNYKDLRDRNQALSGLMSYRFAPMSLSNGAANARLWGFLVSGNYFEVLGVQAILGRTILSSDDVRKGGHPVIVVSYDCWQRRFAGDPNLPGKTAKINGLDFTILGVLPRGFRGTELFYIPEAYVPMAMAAQIEPGSNWYERRESENIFLVGRLKPGVNRSQAEAALDTVTAQLGREYPSIDDGLRIRLSPPGLAGTFLRGPVIGFTGVLLGVTGLVLLVACTNLAGLLLARASDRRREIGICLALGASRGRLIRQMLIENLTLSAAGGAAGLLLAVWLTQAIAAWRPPADLPVDLSAGVDTTVVLFTSAIAMLTSLVFGLAPAMQATRTDLLPALKNAGSQALRRWALRDAVVVVQVALSVVLLAGSVLVVRSLQNALHMRLGFDPQGVAAASFDLSLHGYNESRGHEFQQRLLEKVRAVPGLESAALADRLPLGLDFSKLNVYIEGKPVPKANEVPTAFSYDASPGYFHAMGSRLIAGREFHPSDRPGQTRVAIVNQAFVDRLMPGEQPIGRRYRVRSDGEWREIVGVVENGKHFTLGESGEPAVWECLEQDYSPQTVVVARSAMPAEETVALLRKAVLDLDPGIAFYESGTLTDHLRFPLFPARAAAAALASFGGLALLLAAIGVYGLMAYSVSRRTREIGIRVALGAGKPEVLRNVMMRAGYLLGSGLVLGIAAASAAGPLYSAILYGTNPRDPLTMAAASGLILLIGLGACVLPARRALGIAPAMALRED